MVSLDTYRARIGMFNRAGKPKQSKASGFDASVVNNDGLNWNGFKSLRISRKLLCIFSMVLLVIFGTLSEYPSSPHGWKSKPVSNCLESHEFLTKSDTILQASALATKLIIGNVEANPGPMDFKEFLAFLFVDAEDSVVKDVLKEIKACQDRPTNIQKVKNKNVEALKATIAYLNDWNKDDDAIKGEIDMYTKEGLVHLVIKKIYNMAPQKCSSCLKTSHFKPGEYCVLECISCNRSACINCYESDREKLKSVTMFNKSIFQNKINLMKHISRRQVGG